VEQEIIAVEGLKPQQAGGGVSVILEHVADARAVTANSGLVSPRPKIVSLLRIEKPVDETELETLEMAAAIRQALNNPAITVRALPQRVVLVEGRVGTQRELDQMNVILRGWTADGRAAPAPTVSGGTPEPGGRINVVNAVQIDSSVARSVLVRARVVDIDKRALRDIGVEWGSVLFGGTAGAGVRDQPFLIGQQQAATDKLFGGGKILPLDPIGARVKALEEQNKAKVLSEPSLLVLDGREATFLAGGEIPIPMVQGTGVMGGAGSVTVQFREFGVRLRILPTITSEETLQLDVTPEVSSLDYGNAVRLSGFDIPALKTRRAQTIVNVKNGQSLVIGGLIQSNQSNLLKKIPLLGDLPIIGEFFKTRAKSKGDSELVIVVTPEIVKANNTAIAGGGVIASASVAEKAVASEKPVETR